MFNISGIILIFNDSRKPGT